ncbi:unnamed protein product [Pedinophyceae sp. YPF-701]|nr:unnamed protein product [Pedinophyceae sp. YPF-701]
MDDKFAPQGLLTLDPEELVFRNVRPQQVYRQKIRVTNNLNAPVEATIRPGIPDRYTVSHPEIRLGPGECTEVAVSLRVTRIAQNKRSSTQGIRDSFLIRSKYFDQKFHATMFMDAPDGGQTSELPPKAPQGTAVARPGARQQSQAAQDSSAKHRVACEPAEDLVQEVVDADSGGPRGAPGPPAPPGRAHVPAGEGLQDKDELIRSLKARLDIAHRSARPESSETPSDGARAAAMELRGANKQLRARVKELEGENDNMRGELVWLRQLQDELEKQAPDAEKLVSVAVGRERAEQEARSRKALELLQAKDEAVTAFQRRMQELQASYNESQRNLRDTLQKLDAAEARVGDLLQVKGDTQRQLEKVTEAAARETAALKSCIAEMSSSTTSSAAESASVQETERLREIIESLEARLEAKDAALDAARGVEQTLKERLDAQQRASPKPMQERAAAGQRDAEVIHLRMQVRDLQAALDAARADAQRPRAPAANPASDSVESLSAKVDALEKRNAELLAVIRRRPSTGSSEAPPGTAEAEAQGAGSPHPFTEVRQRAQLQELARENEVLRDLIAKHHQSAEHAASAATKKAIEDAYDQSREITSLLSRVADAERHASSCESAKIDAESVVRQLRSELSQARAEIESWSTRFEREQQRARRQEEASSSAACRLRTECESALGRLEERNVQIGILTETIEALQAGTASERDQRIISLTAQLAASRAAEAALECRAAELVAELQCREAHIADLKRSESELVAGAARASADLAVAREERDRADGELQAARRDLQRAADKERHLSMEVDKCQLSLKRAQADFEGVKAALEQARLRHAAQLAAERADAAAAVQAAREESFKLASSGDASSVWDGLDHPQLLTAIRDLTHAIRQRSQGEDVSHLDESAQQMANIVLEAERARFKAESESRMCRARVTMSSARLAEAERTLEERLSDWQASESARAHERGQLERLLELTRAHANETVGFHVDRVKRVEELLDRASKALIEAETSSATDRVRAEAQTGLREAAERRAAAAEAARNEANARVRAIIMEAAGTPNVFAEDGIAEGVDRRDRELKEYFEREVTKMLCAADPQEKILYLTRQICSLKLVESQLLASAQAARKRADAACVEAGAVRALLERHPAHDTSCQQVPARQAGHADLVAQLATHSQELARAQELVASQRQRAERAEAKVQEAERALAAEETKYRKAVSDAQTVEARVREDANRASAARVEELDAELKRLHSTHIDTVAALRAELQAVQKREDDVRRKAVHDARAAVPAPEVVEAMRLDLGRAEQKIAELHCTIAGVDAENAALVKDIKDLEQEVLSLRDLRDTQGPAIQALQSTLGKIESAAAAASDRPGGKALQFGKGKAGVPMEELSRELVKVRLAEADAQRKLRVSARAEMEALQQLHEREQRIQELKENLEVANARLRGADRDSAAQQSASAPSSPRRLAQRIKLAGSDVLAGGEQGQKCQASATEVAALKSELARRDARIEHLKVQAARAMASQQDREAEMERLASAETNLSERRAAVERTRKRLLQLHSAVSNAITTARSVASLTGAARLNSVLHRKPAQDAARPGETVSIAEVPHVVDDLDTAKACEDLAILTQELVQGLQEKDSSFRRALSRIKALEAALMSARIETHASPLESSQRSVIRDLTARCNQLAHEKAEARRERDRLAQRLKELRFSLGTGTAQDAQGGKENRGPDATGLHEVVTEPRNARTAPDQAASVQAVDVDEIFRRLDSLAEATTAAPRVVQEQLTTDGRQRRVVQGYLLPNLRTTSKVLQESSGLCELLRVHLDTLQQSGGSIAEALAQLARIRPPVRGDEVGKLFMDEETREQLVSAAGAMSAEIESLESALRVLTSNVSNVAVRTQEDVGLLRDAADDESGSSFQRDAATQADDDEKAQLIERRNVLEEGMAKESAAAQTCREDLEQAQGELARCKEEVGNLQARVREAELARDVSARHAAEAATRLEAQDKAAKEKIERLEETKASLTDALQSGLKFDPKLRTGPPAECCGPEEHAQLEQRIAEVESRALQQDRQARTEISQLRAQLDIAQQDADAVRESLQRERQERDRVAVSLRETIAGLKLGGQAEEKLQCQVVRLQEDLENAMQERARAQAKAQERKVQLRSLVQRVQNVKEQWRGRLADAEARTERVRSEVDAIRRSYREMDARLAAAHNAQAVLQDKLGNQIKDAIAQATRDISTSVHGPGSAIERMMRELEDLERLTRVLEGRCRGLEAQLREAQQQEEAGQDKVLRLKESLRATKQDAEAKVKALTDDMCAVKEELEVAKVNLQEARLERDALQATVSDMERAHEEHVRKLNERHMKAVADIQGQFEQERLAARAEAEAGASAAETRALRRCEAQLVEAEARVTTAEKVARQREEQAKREMDSLAEKFRSYRELKIREVAHLESALKDRLAGGRGAASMMDRRQVAAGPQTSPQASQDAPASPPRQVVPDESRAALSSALDALPGVAGVVGEIHEAIGTEALAAVYRQVELERVDKEQALRELAAARSRCEVLEREVDRLGRELRDAVARAEQETHVGMERARGEIKGLEEQLRAAQRESARRLRALQAAEDSAGRDEAVPLSQLLAERESRQDAEARAHQARAEARRVSQSQQALRRRVEELETKQRELEGQGLAGKVATMEVRLRQANADLARKTQQVQELQARTADVVRAAEAKGAAREQEQWESKAQKLRSEIRRRDAQIRGLQQEVENLQGQLSDAHRLAKDASGRESRAQRSSRSEASALRARVEHLLQAVRGLSRVAHRAAAVLRAATRPTEPEAPLAAQGDQALERNIEAVASAAGIDAAEIRDLLNMRPTHGSASGSHSAPSAADLGTLADLLLDVETALARPAAGSDDEAVRRALESLVAALEEAVHRSDGRLVQPTRS